MRSTLTVASWNVAHGEPRPDDLGACVASLGADLVGLQEVDVGVPSSGGQDQPAAIAAATGMHVAFGEVGPLRGGRYGNVLVSRWPLHDVDAVSLPVGRGAQRRGALVASVAVKSRSVALAVTHLGLDEREAVRQLLVVLDRLALRPGPRVLLGDLNLRTEQAAPWLAGDGYAVTRGSPTFPGARPRIRIDHVAVAGGAVVASQVRRLPISDHCAVRATVVLP